MRRTLLGLLLVATALPVRSARATVATDICGASADPCVMTTTKSVTPGSVLDFGARALDLRNKGKLVVSSGLMTILAGSVRVESGGDLLGSSTGDTAASIKVMATGDIRVETGGNGAGTVNVSANLNPGQIDLIAGGNVVIAGTLDANAANTNGSGGVINVSGDGTVTVSGAVSAKAGLLGLGGAIIMRAGGALGTSALIRADGGDGGDVELDSTNADVTTGADVNASAGGTFGDGGTVTILAARNVTVNGNFLLPAAGSDVEGGGTGGDVDVQGTAGTVTLNGDIVNNGAAPDGDAGAVDVAAGLDFNQPGSIFDQGNGVDSCGGFMLALIGRTYALTGDIDESGGFCGGDMEADAGSVSVSAASEINADGGQDGGTVTLFAQQVTDSGNLHATATGSGGTAGVVQVAGCTINLPSGAQIKSDGVNGLNLLQAAGQLTIGGTLSSRPTGHNRFEFRDPTKPPVIQGTASVLPTQDCAPAKGCLVTTLPACATAAVCGNSVLEPGEGCDDSNTNACDGCSPTCQVEGCGNGTIECGEECDDGAANGAPGDPCDASCRVAQGTTTAFIPASHRGRNGCLLEWALQTEPMPGFPSTTQTCIDGDPACDQDGVTDGVCTFHLSACLNVTDARLPGCPAQTLDYVKVRRPNPLSPSDPTEASNAQNLVSALEALGITVRSGDTTLQQGTPVSARDRCTQPFVLRVPHVAGTTARRLLSAGVTAASGDRSSNRISLACAHNPAVCGNRVVEVTEQCDDGNTASCDGCSAQCRREICGNRVIDCGEDCDDGALNGQPGDACSARCTVNPPPGRIPAGSSSRDCVEEWALDGQLATSKNGIPSTKQTCVDNDPSCDFDPTPGRCRLHLWTCVGGDDTRLGCAASPVAGLTLQRPKATDTGPAGAARQALVDAFGRLPLPTDGSAEVCTARVELDVPAGRSKLLVSAEATTTAGQRDRDTLKLTCAAAP